MPGLRRRLRQPVLRVLGSLPLLLRQILLVRQLRCRFPQPVLRVRALPLLLDQALVVPLIALRLPFQTTPKGFNDIDRMLRTALHLQRRRALHDLAAQVEECVVVLRAESTGPKSVDAVQDDCVIAGLLGHCHEGSVARFPIIPGSKGDVKYGVQFLPKLWRPLRPEVVLG